MCLAPAALRARLEEEINRAGRHGTALSCLLIAVEGPVELDAISAVDEALAYVGRALRHELRRFDRVGGPTETGELLVLLPGADGPRGEVVARRVLARLRAIKLETRGERRALRVAIGLAAWREGMSASALLAAAHAAATGERLSFRDALRI